MKTHESNMYFLEILSGLPEKRVSFTSPLELPEFLGKWKVPFITMIDKFLGEELGQGT